jgi:phage-related protein
MRGLGSGVFEIALAHRGDAFRVVYAVQLGDALWVVHAFQKKSTHGIKTPKHEVDLIVERMKRLKQMLKE